jgi:hypothetical protein
MGVDCQPASEAEFPDPAEQAVALLEACHGDIREAEWFAAINVRSARDERDRNYWTRVRLLVSKPDQCSGVI